MMNIVSLDMMTFTHPTFFSEKYMSGYITLGGGVGVPITTAVTADQLDPAHIVPRYVSTSTSRLQ